MNPKGYKRFSELAEDLEVKPSKFWGIYQNKAKGGHVPTPRQITGYGNYLWLTDSEFKRAFKFFKGDKK